MPEIRSITRNNHPVALGLFVIAYIGVLVIMFAPKGTFNDLPVVRSQAQAAVSP